MNKVTTSPSKKFVSFLRSGIRKIVYRPTAVDFVFNAGAACRTATMLRRVNMRTFSSPLDWMFRYDLSLYSDLLHKREFDLFREYEENEESPSEHRNVRDLRTGMISLHHFTKNQSIQEQLPDFHATMNKRLQRLISEIQQSKDVGIVMNRDIPAEEIKEFIDSLSRLSPSCAFHVLNVRHSETQSRVTWKKVSGTGRHSIREVWFNDTHPAGNMEDGNAEWWLGNYRIWKKMLIRAFVLRKKKQKEDKV